MKCCRYKSLENKSKKLFPLIELGVFEIYMHIYRERGLFRKYLAFSFHNINDKESLVMRYERTWF